MGTDQQGWTAALTGIETAAENPCVNWISGINPMVIWMNAANRRDKRQRTGHILTDKQIGRTRVYQSSEHPVSHVER